MLGIASKMQGKQGGGLCLQVEMVWTFHDSTRFFSSFDDSPSVFLEVAGVSGMLALLRDASMAPGDFN